MAGKERRESDRLPTRAGDQRSSKRVAELIRGIERPVVPLVLAARITPVRAARMDEAPVLVDVLERMQQRFLPADKEDGGEKREG